MPLFTDIERFSDRPAIIGEDDKLLDYRSFVDLSDALVGELAERRHLVAIESANTSAPIAAYVGALRAGHAVMLVGANGATPETRLAQLFQPEAVFRQNPDGEWGFEHRDVPPAILHPDLAVLLSTSGSTGSPKLVRLSHANLLANARSIAEYLQLTDGERAITSLPPYYSYGMSVVNSHLLHGHALVLTEESVTDAGFWERVERHGVTSFAGVPHSFDLLERTGFLTADHPSLRYYTQAGGRLPPDKVRLFADHAAARGRRFYVMYGQTEAAPRMAYLPPDQASAHPDCIGVAISGGRFAIDADDHAGAPGRGELVYHGPNVMMGYALDRDELALGAGPEVLRTGDIAERTDNGLYRIVGRASRFAKLFGLRIGLDDVEQRLQALGIAAAAAGDDQGLVVAIEDAARRDQVAEVVGTGFGLPPSAYTVLVTDPIPRLPTGKVDYPRILRDGRASAARGNRAGSLRQDVARAMGLLSVSGSDSFVGLQGDSLNYIQVSLLIEERLGQVPAGWETLSFDALEAMTPSVRKGPRPVDTDILLRAAAITFVLYHHASVREIGGAAYSLLAVAGYNFARFQVPQLEQGRTWSVLKAMAMKVALPYFILISVLFAYLGQVFVPQYLLVSNLTTADGNGDARLVVYWFIETYIDLFLIFSILYLIPAVRRWSRTSAWPFALGLLLAGTLLRGVGESHGDLNVFFKNGPLFLAQLFVFGWAVAFANTLPRKVALLLYACILFPILPPGRMDYGVPIILVAMAMLIFVPRVPVGNVSARVVAAVAAASLYIYMSHPLILQVMRKLFHGTIPGWAIPPVMLLCLLVGVAIWKVIDHPHVRGWRGKITGSIADVLGRRRPRVAR